MPTIHKAFSTAVQTSKSSEEGFTGPFYLALQLLPTLRRSPASPQPSW